MARILVSEPHGEARRMLERMVTRLGHKSIALDETPATPAQLRSADVLLVEPAAPRGTALAHTAHVANPSLAIVCASVAAPPVEFERFGHRFAGYLLKPFTIEQLHSTLQQAIVSNFDSPLHNGRRAA
jgi:CheY-like chemotaxis protein